MSRGGPRRPASVNSELTTLSGVFALAVRHKLVRENPCDNGQAVGD